MMKAIQKIFLLVSLISFSWNLFGGIEYGIRLKTGTTNIVEVFVNPTTSYPSPPFSQWNVTGFNIKWPSSLNQNAIQTITNRSSWQFLLDPQYPTGFDGGDGFFYLKYYSTNQHFTSLMAGNIVVIAEIQIGDLNPPNSREVGNSYRMMEELSLAEAIPGDDNSTPYMNNILGNQYSGLVSGSTTVILPIYLKSFTAQPYTDNSVLLEWTSSVEINSSHFDIERSEDGLNWDKVGEVQAAGNSDIETNYSFIDRGIELRRNTTKVFYYRLNMIDQDASQEYSDVKAVRLTNEGYADVTIFPNPTAELLNIDISSDLEDANIKYEITDIQGRRLITESIDISVQRIHTVNLRDKGLDSGVYMVRLFNDREILSAQKVVLVSR